MRVINDNDTKETQMVRTMSPKPIILNINIKKYRVNQIKLDYWSNE